MPSNTHGNPEMSPSLLRDVGSTTGCGIDRAQHVDITNALIPAWVATHYHVSINTMPDRTTMRTDMISAQWTMRRVTQHQHNDNDQPLCKPCQHMGSPRPIHATQLQWGPDDDDDGHLNLDHNYWTRWRGQWGEWWRYDPHLDDDDDEM